jgi:hypothetical protein
MYRHTSEQLRRQDFLQLASSKSQVVAIPTSSTRAGPAAGRRQAWFVPFALLLKVEIVSPRFRVLRRFISPLEFAVERDGLDRGVSRRAFRTYP